jgi:hypothetical protein
MSHKIILLSLSLTVTTLFAKVSVGEWRTHFSCNDAQQVVYAEDKVYVQSGEKLYSYSPEEGIETYTVISGLSGHNVAFISWCADEQTLVILYSDGNIDFLTSNGIINLPDFKDKSIMGDKTLNDLRIYGSYAYLSTGIGLVVLNVAKKEISDTYYLSFSSSYTETYDAASYSDSLIVATASGLYTGKKSDNLEDYSYWKELSFVTGKTASQVVCFANKLYALTTDGIVYCRQSSGWEPFINQNTVSSISVDENYFFANAGTTMYLYNTSLDQMTVDNVLNYSATFDETSNTLYAASGSNGLSILPYQDSKYTLTQQNIRPDGPTQMLAWNPFFKDGALYATAGGRWKGRFWNAPDVMVFQDEAWHSMDSISQWSQSAGISLNDFVNLAFDPEDNRHFFITTWGDGLLEFRDSTFYKRYNQDNSPLRTVIPGRYCRVDGAVFDEDGNLWMLNSKYYNESSSSTDSSLYILKSDSTWFNPYYAKMPSSPTWNSILFTSNNQVWMNSARSDKYGIFVLDYNETLEDTSDDQTIFYSQFLDQDGLTVKPWEILCMTEDLSGTIWIGTNLGPILASSTSNIFKSSYNFTRVKIPRDDGTDNADYLLTGIKINCIAVDGANRKWIGTYGQGVYLVSADGLTMVHSFSTDNSPLPSDYICSITINPETGEVFFGTEEGLVSYRSDATEGAASYSQIHVFPNPVRPGYAGLITVTGLMEKSQVRITDLAGNTIVSGTSLGGQFTWDGYTVKGKHAASGVYLVFCASEDGIEKQTCKFMIVN